MYVGGSTQSTYMFFRVPTDFCITWIIFSIDFNMNFQTYNLKKKCSLNELTCFVSPFFHAQIILSDLKNTALYWCGRHTSQPLTPVSNDEFVKQLQVGNFCIIILTKMKAKQFYPEYFKNSRPDSHSIISIEKAYVRLALDFWRRFIEGFPNLNIFKHIFGKVKKKNQITYVVFLNFGECKSIILTKFQL